MRIAVYIGRKVSETDERIVRLTDALLNGGVEVYSVKKTEDIRSGTDMMLSVGGDGTFLSAAKLVADSALPVAGVNLGRLGFLSENHPEDIAGALISGDYAIENRSLLKALIESGDEAVDSWPYALNEMTVRRSGSAMLGVDLTLDDVLLPTYWADGLVISTSSGSTAYSLSVGGPIVLPESRVLIVSPIAPHNLNVRPLVVPDSTKMTLRMHSRDGRFEFSADNRVVEVSENTPVTVSLAQFSLRRVRLNKSDFMHALIEKLHWGDDLRNVR